MAVLAIGLIVAAAVVAFTWAGETADTRCYPLLFPSPNHALCGHLDRQHGLVAGAFAAAGITAAVVAAVQRNRQRRPEGQGD